MARKCSVERAKQKTGGFATAKKNIVIQYQERERSTQNLLELIKRNVLEQGVQEEDIQELDVYIKPEEQMVFYVINKNINRQIPF